MRWRAQSIGAGMALALIAAAALGTAWAQTMVSALMTVSPVRIVIEDGDTRAVTLKL